MLPGGTDQEHGGGAGAHASKQVRFLRPDDFQDARYAVRARLQLLPWSTIIAGVGMVITGWAQHNTVLLATGFTAVVVAFIPRARPAWVYEVARTWAIKQGWAAVPAEERPLRTPDEILGVRFSPLPERERPN